MDGVRVGLMMVEESDEQRDSSSGGGAAMAALHQCELIQNMIDISISSLQGLRTKCAASNDLTQQEIRTLEVKLMKYICKQLQCKQKVPDTERPLALNSYPRLENWLRTINVRPELIELSLDALLHMPSSQVKETMRRLGSSSEDCTRLCAALNCLKSASESGEFKEDSGCWFSEPMRRDSGGLTPVDQIPLLGGSLRPHSPSPLARPMTTPSTPSTPLTTCPYPQSLTDPSPYYTSRPVRLHGHTSTPPITPPSRRRHRLKPPCTPPPPSRKVLHLLPNITLTRSKSHESQLGHHNVTVHRSSPQALRRDIGLAVTHRFSTKSWLSQTCQVCQKNMIFGVKCKHCRLKCHNKCTKEAPPCRISFLPITKIRRTESVPSDINNPVDRPPEAPQFGTLPKAITKKDQPPALNQLDSSSNPSSTTSSTPSSPAPFQHSNPPSVTPPPNPSPKGHRDNRFHFPEEIEAEEEEDVAVEDEEEEDMEELNHGSEGECEGDELDDLPSTRGGTHWKGPISRKASQTSVYLQEWDIPFEQLDLGELIGKGRWGRVHRGRWHGEVAIRLLEIDGNNQDHLKLFKKEVMNYRQTRHENVVLFMGACMAPPHLAIITSFCKGRTLYSVVRDTKNTLDINKTRQIAQEIVKGMGYLHAKGIVHKDLKSKNVFHDTNKVVITDFGLFGISGVVQEGRRENELKLPHGWICYLAPEIVRKMSPGNNEDRLPFSNAADVYAFGTIWYELQARDWPITSQPVEATIWQVGSGEGIRRVLAEINLGKEVTEILSACWSYDARNRPTFTQLADMLEKLPKLNRRLSHPGHFWKSAEYRLSNIQKSSISTCNSIGKLLNWKKNPIITTI
uniref:non-specific serine/threonine protein kinase n=1 Tax=Cyprinus carpio TaxID=7962 RepID=A0A8C1K4G7_CYPCA